MLWEEIGNTKDMMVTKVGISGNGIFLGIETEGICYTARFLCYKCWGMPNEIVIHDDS